MAAFARKIIHSLERQRESLEQAAELLPLVCDAQAYAALKERAAGLELDAHRRAQLVQDQAEGQVRQLHEQMAQWSNQVRLEYEALRAEVESTVTHAARQLEQAGKALDQVNALMERQEAVMTTIAAESQKQPEE